VVNAGHFGRECQNLRSLFGTITWPMRNNPFPFPTSQFPTPYRATHSSLGYAFDDFRVADAGGEHETQLAGADFLVGEHGSEDFIGIKARLGRGRPTALISATIRAQSSVPKRPSCTASRPAATIPSATASPCWTPAYSITFSMACPNVWPKFEQRPHPALIGILPTTAALIATFRATNSSITPPFPPVYPPISPAPPAPLHLTCRQPPRILGDKCEQSGIANHGVLDALGQPAAEFPCRQCLECFNIASVPGAADETRRSNFSPSCDPPHFAADGGIHGGEERGGT